MAPSIPLVRTLSRAARPASAAWLVVALVAGACSAGGSGSSVAGPLGGSPAAGVGAADGSPSGGDASGDSSSTAGTAGTPAAPDPCAVLTIADVQPFFTVPIATELPSAVPDTCEWAAGDAPLGVPTSFDVMVQGGDDARVRWQLATLGGTPVMFSGVGDQAEHLPGSTDFLAIRNGVICGITTLGWDHLVGKSGHPMDQLSDSDATAVAQDYGTLCNRLYGSGNTTPTLVAQAQPSSAAGSVAPGSPSASIAIPAIGGTFGNGFPLPVGVDCTGSHLTTDLDGSPECSTLTSGDPRAIYPFYLQTLPAKGYTIHNERDGVTDNGTEIASIIFGGNGVGDFSMIGLRGLNVTITLRQP